MVFFRAFLRLVTVVAVLAQLGACAFMTRMTNPITQRSLAMGLETGVMNGISPTPSLFLGGAGTLRHDGWRVGMGFRFVNRTHTPLPPGVLQLQALLFHADFCRAMERMHLVACAQWAIGSRSGEMLYAGDILHFEQLHSALRLRLLFETIVSRATQEGRRGRLVLYAGVEGTLHLTPTRFMSETDAVEDPLLGVALVLGGRIDGEL